MARQRLLLIDLPEDICVSIFHYLSASDILKIRQTSKGFLKLTQLRSIWYDFLHIHILQQNIPVPGLSRQAIETLTASQLEKYTLHALRLRHNWTSLSPVASKGLEMPPESPSRIVNLRFLPGERNRWLISLGLTTGADRTFILRCWDLEASPPTCVAMRYLQKFGSMVVNTDANYPSHLAIQSPHVEVLRIDFDCGDSASGFVTTAIFPDKTGGLLSWSGSTILSHEHDYLYLWNINTPQNHLELRNLERQFERPHEAVLRDGFIIIIRPSTLELYGLPSLDSDDIVLYPASVYKWQWKLDSACTPGHPPYIDRHSRRQGPINLLIRYGSMLPWPINILHHYVLCPNMSYDQLSPIGSNNLPYNLMPFLQRTIASPIRLFATYDMTLGSYGTAVWIDNHIEDYFERSDRGQRLAGSFAPLAVSEDDLGEAAQSTDPQTVSTSGSTVFDVCEEDKWTRLAVDEEEGRIAVGCADGTILLLEYA